MGVTDTVGEDHEWAHTLRPGFINGVVGHSADELIGHSTVLQKRDSLCREETPRYRRLVLEACSERRRFHETVYRR